MTIVAVFDTDGVFQGIYERASDAAFSEVEIKPLVDKRGNTHSFSKIKSEGYLPNGKRFVEL